MAFDPNYDTDYENDEILANALLEALKSKYKVLFEQNLKKVSSFQLDKRYRDLDYRTLLHKAAQDSDLVEFADLLIKAGANTNYDDFRQFKPIHYSCESGNKDTVQKLLELKVDVNAQNSSGDTPLHILVRNNFTDCLVMLLEDERVNVELKNKDGHTPLDMAKANGCEDICNTLQKKIKENAISKRPNNEKMLLNSPMKTTQLQEQDYKILSNVTTFLIIFFVSIFLAFADRIIL